MLIPVLAYHDVSDKISPGIARVTLGQFSRQMAWLRENGYRSLTLSHYIHSLTNDPASLDISRDVLITFDDTYETIDRAAEIMAAHGLVATTFVISRFAGKANSWDYQFFGHSKRHADFAMIRQLLDAGWEVGSHTHTHAHLPDLPPEKIREELSLSRRILEEATGEKIRSISYPFGRANDITISIARETGYQAGVTLGMAVASDPAAIDPLALPRIGIYLFDGLRGFRQKCRSRDRDKLARYLRYQRMISSFSAGTVLWKKIIR